MCVTYPVSSYKLEENVCVCGGVRCVGEGGLGREGPVGRCCYHVGECPTPNQQGIFFYLWYDVNRFGSLVSPLRVRHSNH